VAALVFLRGRDADGRLRELAAQRARARPVLGALADTFLSRRHHEPLGFRCLGDWSRERIGVGARAVREWGRVWRALEALPLLREAVLAGEVSWSVARKVVGRVSPQNEAACLESVRGRTLRAVEALLRALAPPGESPTEPPQEDRVPVRVVCTPRVATKWVAALELARRMAGEPLCAWECAEALVAECASAIGGTEPLDATQRRPPPPARGPEHESESGLRARAWPRLRWRAPPARKTGRLERLARGLDDCSPRELDRRFRAAMAFLQRVDFEIGRILRQLLERKLYRELGFESFQRYVQERLDLSPRTARRLLRVARAEHAAPAVASAFRAGRITLLQAEVLLRGGSCESLETLELALRVTLRRLEDEVPERAVAFWAPREVAALFEAMLKRLGLEAMLDHALATWLQAGARFHDYADFARDGYRCTVPGCTARRNLQSHHIRFRSAGGPDVAWNRTTLCAQHHQRGVHAQRGALGARWARLRTRGGPLPLRGREDRVLGSARGVDVHHEAGDVSAGAVVPRRVPVAVVAPMKRWPARAQLLAKERLEGEEGDLLLAGEGRQDAIRLIEVPLALPHRGIAVEEPRQALLPLHAEGRARGDQGVVGAERRRLGPRLQQSRLGPLPGAHPVLVRRHGIHVEIEGDSAPLALACGDGDALGYDAVEGGPRKPEEVRLSRVEADGRAVNDRKRAALAHELTLLVPAEPGRDVVSGIEDRDHEIRGELRAVPAQVPEFVRGSETGPREVDVAQQQHTAHPGGFRTVVDVVRAEAVAANVELELERRGEAFVAVAEAQYRFGQEPDDELGEREREQDRRRQEDQSTQLALPRGRSVRDGEPDHNRVRWGDALNIEAPR
jgi:hypothetical protein